MPRHLDWFHPFKFTLTSIQRRWKTESERNLVSKRPAHEGPNTAPDAKRVKDSHDVLTEPDVKTPAVRRVPFKDKPTVLDERNGEIEY
ncbi:Acyl-CoA N-acyltransferase [Penicillium rubens]|nr:Acyl-CoA N-acyltransferase [Penicillium rubens]